MFLKRYDSKRVRGWVSAKDMILKELGDGAEEIGVRPEKKPSGRR
jgi:hypothetical protein